MMIPRVTQRPVNNFLTVYYFNLGGKGFGDSALRRNAGVPKHNLKLTWNIVNESLAIEVRKGRLPHLKTTTAICHLQLNYRDSEFF